VEKKVGLQGCWKCARNF